jgi:HK97 family phage major capsid protein
VNIETLQAEIEAVTAEIRALHMTEDGELREFTPDDQAAFDALQAKRDTLTATFDRHAAILAAANDPARVIPPAPAGPEVMRRVEPFDGTEVRTLTAGQARDRALKALEMRELTGHMGIGQVDHVDRLLRRSRDRNYDGDYIARRLLITEREEYKSAFLKVMSRTNPVLTAEEGRALEELRAMSIGTDASGGFGVPVLIDPTIVLTGQGSPNDIYNISRVETITNDEWKGVSSAGVSWSFDAEAAAVSDDSPTLAQPTVTAHMTRGFIPYSIEVGMDYPGFAAEMSRLLAEGYSEIVAEKVTTGSGSGEPFGIVTALDANTNVEVTPTTDGAFGAVDLYKLWDALPIRYRRAAGCAWMSSTDAQNEVRNFGTTLGSNFTVDLTAEDIPRLFGRRYYVNDFMADFTGTTGAANLLIVGDWSNFLIAQRAGMSVELVPHLFDVTNNRPTGQRGWFAWARIGSDSVNDLGFRLLQNQ